MQITKEFMDFKKLDDGMTIDDYTETEVELEDIAVNYVKVHDSHKTGKVTKDEGVAIIFKRFDGKAVRVCLDLRELLTLVMSLAHITYEANPSKFPFPPPSYDPTAN